MDIGTAKTSPVAARPNIALKRLRLAAALTAGLALIAGAGHWIYRHFTHVIVDDARIAADMIALASRVPGWVMELPVIAGDEPHQGALLIRIDSRDSALTLQELDARLANIAMRRAELDARITMVDRLTSSQEDATRAKLEAAQAALPAAEADRVYAETEYARANQLIGTGSGTRQRHDQTRALLESATQRVLAVAADIRTAEAQLANAGAAREEMGVLRHQRAALEPQEREITAQRQRIAIDIEDRTIRMPFGGVVDRVFVDPGEYVTPGQRVMLVHDPRRVRVEANVKETEIVGAAATSEFALLPSPNPSGNFTKITQRLPVRIALENLPADGALRPGMMVVVETPARE